MKYIIAKANISGMERNIPLIFPNELTHSVMANYFIIVLYAESQADSKFEFEIVSAGFINISGKCYGKSVSLNLESREQDTDIVNSYDYFHGLID